MFYDPDTTPSSEIGGFVNAYWNGFLEYWDLYDTPTNSEPTDAERQRAVHFNRLGEALRESLHSLDLGANARAVIHEMLASSGLSEEAIDSQAGWVAQLLSNHKIVRDCVQIQLAFEATDSLLGTAEKRFAPLLSLVRELKLAPRAQAYLDRATRLFLWGFDPECILMCRSVLEAALTSALDSVIELDEPPPSLENLIRLAGEKGLLDGYERAQNRRRWRARSGTPLWRAERIRWAGNRIVHDVPVITGKHPSDIDSAEMAVTELADLLGRLFP
jgi:hypothetical protein